MEILLAIIVVGLLIAGMAIGVLMGRPPNSSSCGPGCTKHSEADYSCEICGDDPNKCEEISSQAPLGYDVGSAQK